MGYRKAFADTDFSKEMPGNSVPLLAIAATHDSPAYGEQAMRDTLMKWFNNAELAICHDAGHFPMQETPPLLASYIEKFLDKQHS